MFKLKKWFMLNISFWWVSITDWLWLEGIWPGKESPDEKWDKKFNNLSKRK